MVAIKTLLDLLAAAVALFCLAPVAPFLDLPVLLLGAGAVAGGLWCDRHDRYLLAPLPATLLALLAVGWYALQVKHVAEVVAPLVNALVVLLAIRLLTGKQARDYLQIFILALFILAGSSLLSLGIGFLAYLVLLVFTVTISLLLLTVFVTDPRLALPRHDLWRLIRVGLVLPAASLVLMFGFFLILPRTASPLWNFLAPAGETVAGLADSVSPGTFARISSTGTLAFRAEGPELPPEELYWRALVLNQPQEARWVRSEPPAEGGARIAGGRPVTLTIYPEPRTDRFLVTLERPLLVGGIRSQASADRVYRTATVNAKRFRYTVEASPGADLKVNLRSAREFYLTTPAQVSPRVAATAARIAASGAGSAARLAALADFFRESRLAYAQDDLPTGPDPVDAFLFEKRRGYCEFFASAYVTLARLAGIPARLVGGYYGGAYNDLGGYYLVTDDTAHVWVEVLTDEGAWQRVDPSQWASNAGSALGAVRRGGLSPWQRFADTLNYYWVQSVVVFDLSQQLSFWHEARQMLREFRPGALSPDRLFWGSGGLVVVVLLGLGWWRRQRRTTCEARLLAALRARVGNRLKEAPSLECLTPGELAERLDSPPCREFARIYQGAVFRDRPLTAGEVAQLKALLRDI